MSQKWQIVIPMSGFGERFRRAGYKLPKPLIEILGRPLISYVLELFPNETDVHFICNEDHLNNPDYKMRETLLKYCPTGKIHAIKPHKNGPVYAVSQIFDELDLERPVAVNYCDFTGIWDWEGFKKFAEKEKAKGYVICYTGFHPHMLDCTKFAYCKTESVEHDQVLAIQEKTPYTDHPMNEWASCGTYCYDSGKTLKDAYTETLSREDLKFNGEYYVSLTYRPILEKGDLVKVFPIDYFCQWGTPEDLESFLDQYAISKNSLTEQPSVKIAGSTLIPMAGLGSRFAKAGYQETKPLIKVDGKEMVLRAISDLPETDQAVFVIRVDMPHYQEVIDSIKAEYKSKNRAEPKFVLLDHVTEGQACTCLCAYDELVQDQPVTIGACDNGYRYDGNKLRQAINDYDVVVWTKRGVSNAIKRPQHYGWVEIDQANGSSVKSVSVKKPLADPKHDPIVTGAFTFKNPKILKECIDQMIARNGRVNNEFYVDECINDAIKLGYKVGSFEVDDFICWGTPEELKVYEYWLNFIKIKGNLK